MNKANILPRVFKYNNITLEDIDPAALPEEIMASYTEIYPDLNNAVIEGPELTDDAMEYKFTAKVGTKGSEDHHIDAYLMSQITQTILNSDDDESVEPPSEMLDAI